MKLHDRNIVSGTITIVDSVVPQSKLQIGELSNFYADLHENDYTVAAGDRRSDNWLSDMVFGFRWHADNMNGRTAVRQYTGRALIPTIRPKRCRVGCHCRQHLL